MTSTHRDWARTDQLTFRIHSSLTERIDALAADRHISRAAYLRLIVEDALAAAESQPLPVSISEDS